MPSMRRSAVLGLLILGSILLTVAPLASAQEYAQETGDLELTSSLVITFSGDGYAADSSVLLTLTQDDSDGAIDLGTLEVDSEGILSGTITLPDGLSPGTYTLAATGLTEDGATRVLSASVAIEGDVTTGSTTTTTTTTTLAETTTTTEATTTSGTPSTTTVAPQPAPEPTGDSDLLVLILIGIIVIEAAGIGFMWWYYRGH